MRVIKRKKMIIIIIKESWNEKKKIKRCRRPNRNEMIKLLRVCVCARAYVYNVLIIIIIDNKINCQYFSAKYRFLWIINAFAARHKRPRKLLSSHLFIYTSFCTFVRHAVLDSRLVGRMVVSFRSLAHPFYFDHFFHFFHFHFHLFFAGKGVT